MKHSIIFLMMLFSSSTVLAAEEGAPAMGGQMIFLVGFMVVFYFLMWRPQNKRAKEHAALLSKLAKGDEIVTSGGLVGKITKVTDQFVRVEISPTAEISVQRSSIATMLPKGTLKSIE